MVSTRRSQTDNQRAYRIGDKVEIVRGKVVSVGILVRKGGKSLAPAVDASPTNVSNAETSVWTVRIPGKSEKTVPERSLGRIMDGAGSNSPSESDNDNISATGSSPATVASRPPPKARSKKANVSRKRKPAAKPTPPVARSRVHTTRAATRSGGSSIELFKGIEEVVLPPKPKAPPKVAGLSNDNVMKVPMLTGTLYMYRDGPKRHVKFVRTK